jgi:hypothetical protein
MELVHHIGSPAWVRHVFTQWLRWCVRLVILAVVAVLFILYLADSGDARRALKEAEGIGFDRRGERVAALAGVVEAHPLSPAAGWARRELRDLGASRPEDRVLGPWSVNGSVFLPAGIALVLLGIVFLTDWGSRRTPRALSFLAMLVCAGLLTLQFCDLMERLTPQYVSGAVADALTGAAAIGAGWALVGLGLVLLYLEKRGQHRGRLPLWEIERLLPTRRTWLFTAVGLACALMSLLAVGGPGAVGVWGLWLALSGPLVGGLVLGAKRGVLAQVFAVAVGGAAAQWSELASLSALAVAPLAVAEVRAGQAGRRRTLVALGAGVGAFYAVLFGMSAVAAFLAPERRVVEELGRLVSVAAWGVPGHIVIAGVIWAAASAASLPAVRRQRVAVQVAALQEMEEHDQALQVLTLRQVATLLEEEDERFRLRAAAQGDNPLVPRLAEEFTRLRQILASRIFRHEQFLSDRAGVEQGQARELPEKVRALEQRLAAARAGRREAAGDSPEALAEQLAQVRRTQRDLAARLAARDAAVAQFTLAAERPYFEARLDEMFRLIRVFRPTFQADTDQTRPDVKAALDKVGQYFTTASAAGPDAAGSLSGRHDLAMALKRELEADYRRRAAEVAALDQQAAALAADLKHLHELWRRRVVPDVVWTDQQRVFAHLLDETHRQLDLRRRLLAIYRRAEPPLDLP